MSTAVLLALRSELANWEANTFGDPIAAHHRGLLNRYLSGLRTLANSQDDRMRAALLVALALGPRTGALPGAGDLGALVDAATGSDADVVELGVAWGCGWHRLVTPDHDWHGRWVAAVLSLSCLVAGAINQTVRWLTGSVPDVAKALRAMGHAESRQRFTSYADGIALELATGACRCGHRSRLGRAAADSCGRSEHQLSSWRPGTCRLPAFVATGVRGSAQLPVRVGAFATSMLATLLLEDHLVRVDVAEFRVCHRCNPDVIKLARCRAHIDISSLRRGLYDLSSCPDCGGPPDESETYHVGRKNWLIVPAEWGGRYGATHRYRCTECGNLFPVGRCCCPICHRQVPHPDRISSVWVRLAGLSAARSRTATEMREA
jgi:hypothetical protein